ncbi:hypothetical protein NQ317_014150 [Molorchus minor]|uniref:Uncharacterized protein n=1 Tax=Molorchus minor TaxID=1323400 RepID=A0ABQ9J2M4_9CUCU|nr:hypothetical protein NQ317_014150 [Molorchus minor]
MTNKDDESLEYEDLDFDMWEGQFQFIGSAVTEETRNAYGTNGFKKQPVLQGDNEIGVLQQQVGVLQDNGKPK